jgi:hypothetical protein
MPFMVAVSHVCRLWRGLTLSCPTLWTNICVPIAPSYQHWPYSTLAMQLERSGELLLDVTITARFDSLADFELYQCWREWRWELPDQFTRVGRQLEPHARRIRTLVVHLPPLEMWRNIVIFSPDVASFEQLTELEILGEMTRQEDRKPPVDSTHYLIWAIACAPRLQRMNCRFVTFNSRLVEPSLWESALCRHLIHLDVGYSFDPVLSYSMLAAAQAQYSALQTLTLAIDSFRISLADVEAESRLLLCSLHSLRLYEVDTSGMDPRWVPSEKPRAGYLFALLDAPCLRLLDLTGEHTVFDFLSHLADGDSDAGFGGLEHLCLRTDTQDIPSAPLETLPTASTGICEVDMRGLPAVQAALALWSQAEVRDLPSPQSLILKEHAHLKSLLEKYSGTHIDFSVRSEDVVADGGTALRAGVVAWIRENLQQQGPAL